jgi:hypothetical protein
MPGLEAEERSEGEPTTNAATLYAAGVERNLDASPA